MWILPKDVIVKDRVREDYGDIESLTKSLDKHGQGAVITIDKNNVLIDGHRRLTAHIKAFGCEKPILANVYEGDLDYRDMEIEMLCNQKTMTLEEMYKVGQIKEKRIWKQKKTSPYGEKKGVSEKSDYPIKKVAREMGISSRKYDRIKRVFKPETEEEIGKEKAEEIKKIAKKESINIADKKLAKILKAKKQEEDKKTFEEENQVDPSVLEARINTDNYIDQLKQALALIKKRPDLVTDDGIKRFQAYWIKIKKVIEEFADETRRITDTARP